MKPEVLFHNAPFKVILALKKKRFVKEISSETHSAISNLQLSLKNLMSLGLVGRKKLNKKDDRKFAYFLTERGEQLRQHIDLIVNILKEEKKEEKA